MFMNTNPMMLLSKKPKIIPASLNKPILDGKSSSSQEDRISKKIWHENITRPELIAEYKKSIREQRSRYVKRLLDQQTLFNNTNLLSYLSIYKMKCKQTSD
jgi:hypothetical protein